ncbi:MAG: hypothetical protein LBJ03_03505 [Holosporales bacterium]|jgi:hypothetical protein|nr:hypothetical protein [Holosporales bacterium]
MDSPVSVSPSSKIFAYLSKQKTVLNAELINSSLKSKICFLGIFKTVVLLSIICFTTQSQSSLHLSDDRHDDAEAARQSEALLQAAQTLDCPATPVDVACAVTNAVRDIILRLVPDHPGPYTLDTLALVATPGWFVAVGKKGALLISPNGINWFLQESNTVNNLNEVACDARVIVAVGSDRTIQFSTDATVWNTALSVSPSLYGVAYYAGQFVAVGSDGLRLISTNGSDWVSQYPSGHTLNGIACNSRISVTVGYAGTILTNFDGINWTAQISNTDNNLWGIAYGEHQFVAVGNSGTILTGMDGIDWVLQTSGIGSNLFAVTHGNGLFVSVGDFGKVLTSQDGVAWILQASGTDNRLSGITYGGGLYIAVGARGTILTSPDGVTWTLRASGIDNTLFAITRFNVR